MWKVLLASGLCAFSALGAAQAQDRLLSGAAKEIVRVHISNEEETFLGPFASVGKNCSSLGAAKVQMLQPPQHGAASVARRRGEIAFGDGSPLSHCNDKPIVGAVVRYAPADDFVGLDGFSFRITFPNGEVRTKWVSVEVCGCAKPQGQVALAGE
jgi:hypothetical protein